MSKHTPGEWTLRPILSGSENDKGWRISAGDDRDGWTWIADVSPVIDNDRGDASEEGKANAALLQAAPKLLDALSEYVEQCHGRDRTWGDADCDQCRKADAIIASATGESNGERV